jgi:hypothetical protein
MSIAKYGRLQALLLATTSGLALGAAFSGVAAAQTVISHVAAGETKVNSGTITASGSVDAAVEVDQTGKFTNSAGGRIVATNGSVGVGVVTAVASGTTSIVNQGLIEATKPTGSTDDTLAAIYVKNVPVVIENSGSILGKNGAHGIVVTGVASGTSTITNTGLIKADRPTDSSDTVAAIYLTNASAKIVNSGTILGTGGAHGIVVGTSVAAGSTADTTIDNSGLIKSDSGNAIAVYALDHQQRHDHFRD